MKKAARRRLGYANVAATLALVFSMSGGALAASHYLISSTSQINPKVLKKLKGNTGHTGAPGGPGATGPQGAAGKDGAGGKEGKEGREGEEGLPGATGPSNAYSVFHDAGIELESISGMQTLITLSSLPAGAYWILATLNYDNNAVSGQDTPDCELVAGANSDHKRFTVEPNSNPGANDMAISMQVVHTFSEPSNSAIVSCNDFSRSSMVVENLKITAVRVSTVTNTGV
jgi:hypothetical protein